MNKYSDIELRESLSCKNLQHRFNCPFSPYRSDLDFLIHEPSSVPNLFSEVNAISELSLQENSRARIRSEKVLNSPKTTRDPQQKASYYSPDFRKIIKNLDLITGKVTNCGEKVLKEGEIDCCLLKEERVQYYKIPCKDKRSPLKILIKRNYGTVKCFISKKFARPSEELNEYEFTGEFLDIEDKFVWFYHDFFYLSVKALSNCEFVIHVKFGKNKANNMIMDFMNEHRASVINDYEENKKNEDLRNKLNQKVENLLKMRKKKAMQLAKSKNFIKINKVTVNTGLTKESPKWNERKAKVFQRKHEVVKEKVQKAKDLLQQKALRKEIKEKALELAKIQKNLRKKQKLWLRFLFFTQTFMCLQRKIKESRGFHLLALRRKSAARVIQKGFRGFIQYLDPQDLFLLNARDGLLLMHQHLLAYEKQKIEKMLLNSIKVSMFYNKVRHSFEKYMKKILKIQVKVRKFLVRTRERLLDIVKAWNCMLSKLIIENSTAKVNKYTKITSHMRDPIIRKYFIECSYRYLHLIRPYIDAYRLTQAKIFRKRTLCLPYFTYLPSDEALKEMIENALLSNK